MPIFVSDLNGWVPPPDVFIALHLNDENAFWLDREIHATDRFSVIGASARAHKKSSAVFEFLKSELSDNGAAQHELPFEFRPGLVGFLAYDGESIFLQIDRAMVFDHDAKVMYFIGEFAEQKDFDAWHHAALLRLALCGGEQAAYRLANEPLTAQRARVRHSNEEYLGLIESAQAHIAAGDVYQLCLTNQIELEVTGDPLLTFINLRSSNPAPYAAYLKFGSQAILCSSPEQFLKVDAKGTISSKPIKGTRRRDSDPVVDGALALELAEDEKERAENLMIVDLMRNDIGRVAEINSVQVTKLFDVESYATVHQLVSTVEGKLASGFDSVDALSAAFPGGSMTGAPKARAIQIIDELESKADSRGRGIYSGAIGYLTHAGVADFGMTIRTIVVDGQNATIGVGGGITIDSHPAAELEETKLKAAALLRALKSPNPWSSQ
jgi:para-aminobenzoate synthetase component I